MILRAALLLGLALALQTSTALSGEIVEKKTKEAFADRFELEAAGDDVVLRATGCSLRKKFFWKIYVVAGYVDESVDLGQDPGRAIVESGAARQIHLRMLRDAAASKITKGISGALEKCAVVPVERLAEERTQLEELFGEEELAKGSDVRMTYVPGTGLQISLDGAHRGTIEGEDFANSVFAIYYGDPPVDDELKENLLSALP